MTAWILACEALTRRGSACRTEPDGTITGLVRLEENQAAAGLPLALDGLLRQHGRPAAVAVAVGPGSFSGLRVSVAAIRALAWAEDLPVHAVDSLAAMALQAGEGLWWVLMPLKSDTSFHGTYRVAAGRIEVLAAPQAVSDAAQPAPAHPQARPCGPLLAEKPALAVRWGANPLLGPSGWPDAAEVGRAAPSFPSVVWSQLLPVYGLASAPELQRAAGRS